MSSVLLSFENEKCERIGLLPIGPEFLNESENAMALRHGIPQIFGDGPTGPTSSPGSEHSIRCERLLELKESCPQLGSISYVFRRQRPTITSVFHGRLISNNSSDSVAVSCQHETSDVCGHYKSVQDFILAVRASAHPANASIEAVQPEENPFEMQADVDKPGYACPASLDADSEIVPQDDLGPSATCPEWVRQQAPAPPFNVRDGSAFLAVLPRAETPSLFQPEDPPDQPDPQGRPKSPDPEQLYSAAGPPPGSPSRGASPRRAARLEG